jgi:hypothetical protein
LAEGLAIAALLVNIAFAALWNARVIGHSPRMYWRADEQIYFGLGLVCLAATGSAVAFGIILLFMQNRRAKTALLCAVLSYVALLFVGPFARAASTGFG